MTEQNHKRDVDKNADVAAGNKMDKAAGMKVMQNTGLLAAIWRKLYNFLSSAKLAMALLVVILACCIAGVTIVRGERAWTLIFSTLWFNVILVLLVVNVAFCFFGRMWGRKVTLISFGMILFHLSFVLILLGIIYNSLFYFRGLIRLSEGEVLPNSEAQSYDRVDYGRFFNFSKLHGDTTLIKLHINYEVDGANKRSAYEIAVGGGNNTRKDIIYLTKSLDYGGFQYFPDREGYTILVILYDKLGQELYGAYAPLQSHRQKDGKYLYTTGTASIPGSFPFPQRPQKPLMALQATYLPTPLKERSGETIFTVWPLSESNTEDIMKPFAGGKAAVGEKFKAGEYFLSVKEVHYWVAMTVRYEPGKPIVLASLWVGLSGMIITFIGRLVRETRSNY